MAATSNGERTHRRFALLNDRWHNSSRSVSVLALLVLIFCNIPGQSVTRMKYEVGFPFYVVSRFEHGWPLTYLIRPDEGGEGRFSFSFLSPPEKSTVRDCFELWGDREQFRPWWLIANGGIVLLMSFAAGMAFEAWRRQRKRLWQVHLRDCLAAGLIVSLVAAWWVHAQRRHALEKTVFSDQIWIQTRQLGGITWLRLWLGDRWFEFLDRPFSVTIAEPEGWSKLDKLRSVRHVAALHGTTDELANLAKLPQLEALSLGDGFGSFDERPIVVKGELPLLPNLRGLYLTFAASDCRGLDQLTSLESIRITEGCIDEQALREISVLPNLREVALNGLSVDADLAFLSTQTQLTALDLYHSELSVASLESIGHCSDLKVLDLYMCRLDGSGVRHLGKLANLEVLNLSYTNVTDDDLKHLASLEQLRKLDLTRTNTGSELRFLYRMEQLKWLDVSNVSDVDLRNLREALPECSINRH